MNSKKLNNLIKFSFLFHDNMNKDISMSSSDYIIEKWNCYIGVKPKINNLLSYKKLNEKNNLNEMDIFIKNKINNRVNRWGESDYNKIKEIFYFICIINYKSFNNDEYMWLPMNLITEFKKNIGNPNLIKDEIDIGGIHPLIINEINYWYDYTEVKKDLIIITREEKLEKLGI
jgi:hypothetical protein